MKLALSDNNKNVLKSSLIILILGLVITVVITPLVNPPPCDQALVEAGKRCAPDANIGGPMVGVAGVTITIVGIVATTYALVRGLVEANSNNLKLARELAALLAALAGGLIILAVYLYTSHHKNISLAKLELSDKYLQEKDKEDSEFIADTYRPNVSQVTSQSKSIPLDPSTGQARSVTINLHDCAPGAGTVTYPGGSTHFVIRGTKELASYANQKYGKLRVCEFYYGKEVKNQDWDGILNVKCRRGIGGSIEDNKLNFI